MSRQVNAAEPLGDPGFRAVAGRPVGLTSRGAECNAELQRLRR